MPPIAHTDEEEAAFLQNLLSDFDPVDSAQKLCDLTRSDNIGPQLALERELSERQQTCETASELTDSPSSSGFDAWDWDAWSDYVPTPQKPRQAQLKLSKEQAQDMAFVDSGYTPEPNTRCAVGSVEDRRVDHRAQKYISVQVDGTQEARVIVLEDDWVDSPIHTGDIVNVIGSFAPAAQGIRAMPTIHIDKSQNLLIHHPDLLLTPTALSSAPHCTRRPILSSLLRSSPSSSAPANATPSLIYGNVLHDVFQKCLRQGVWDAPTVGLWIDGVLRTRQILGELVRVGIGIEEAKRDILERARGVFGFGNRYIGHVPKSDAILLSTRSEKGQTSLLAISKLHDVEEDIWAPEYGLKGKLDASVQAVVVRNSTPTRTKLFDDKSNPTPDSAASKKPLSFPAPLELKTGRAIAGMEHRAQTMLYTLLMRSRYSAPVEEGLLYYTQSEEVISVPAARNEIRALIGVRNEIAEWMMNRFRRDDTERENRFLPETIDDERICRRCFALDACMLYRKAVDEVVDISSPIAEIYEQKTGHLTSTQAKFFKEWEQLIALEEHDLVRFKKELWTLGAREREAKGRCFSGMVLDPCFSQDTMPPRTERNAIHQATYKFMRQGGDKEADQDSLLNGHMNVGDPITISAEPGLLALACGYILQLTPTSVVVGVGHPLDLPVIKDRIKAKRRAMRMGQTSLFDGGEVVFRIDRDELSGGMGRIRDNLAALFYAGGDSARLRLVVDLAPPGFFLPDPADLSIDSPRCRQHMANLNSNQLEAVEKVLSAEDYALVLGMPGTGKTTLVAALIQVLVELGKTVLLSTYTHSAVDTILAKLKDADFSILRLGNIDKVHPNVRHLTLAARREPQSVEELEQQLMTPPVVATTALSIDHELFSRRKFDYCIVDEASQITLPTCLGPLRFADKFVLVGDHFQLPPLVRSHEARKGGLDMSLFRRLSEAHPSAVVDLSLQYRMNADIMLLSNRLIYNDRLQCGSEEVARQSLTLPNATLLDKLHATPVVKSQCKAGTRCWLEILMNENCKSVFVDTDTVPAPESRVGDLVQNETEALLVQQIVETLIQSGIRETQIGVITPYRQQIKLLVHLLQARPGVEVLTADRSQGRDKDCIVLSMVRSNEEGHVGDLVRDWRRLNVAFTRAARKLIVFGSRRTLKHAPILDEFLQLMDKQSWTMELPNGAHLDHPTLLTPDDTGSETYGKRGRDDDHTSSAKRTKVGHNVGEGILKGRPILKDLVNDTL